MTNHPNITVNFSLLNKEVNNRDVRETENTDMNNTDLAPEVHPLGVLEKYNYLVEKGRFAVLYVPSSIDLSKGSVVIADHDPLRENSQAIYIKIKEVYAPPPSHEGFYTISGTLLDDDSNSEAPVISPDTNKPVTVISSSKNVLITHKTYHGLKSTHQAFANVILHEYEEYMETKPDPAGRKKDESSNLPVRAEFDPTQKMIHNMNSFPEDPIDDFNDLEQVDEHEDEDDDMGQYSGKQFTDIEVDEDKLGIDILYDDALKGFRKFVHTDAEYGKFPANFNTLSQEYDDLTDYYKYRLTDLTTRISALSKGDKARYTHKRTLALRALAFTALCYAAELESQDSKNWGR